MTQSLPLVTSREWTDNVPWIDRPDADIDGYVNALPKRPNYDLRKKLYEWRERGVVVFEREVSHVLIDTMLGDIDFLHTHFKDYDIGVEIRGQQTTANAMDEFPENMTGIKLNHLHCYSRAAAEISLSKNIQDFLSHIFQSPGAVLQSLTFWRGSEQATHIDYPYVCQQKKLPFMAASWTALEDIVPGSGPLGYFAGGHKPDVSKFYDWGEGSILLTENSVGTPTEFAKFLDAQMQNAGLKPECFYPKKGDVLVWHGNLPHRGMPVDDRALTRKSYVTHFTSQEHTPDWLKNEGFSDGPVGVFKNGGAAYVEPSKYASKKLPSWDMPPVIERTVWQEFSRKLSSAFGRKS